MNRRTKPARRVRRHPAPPRRTAPSAQAPAHVATHVATGVLGAVDRLAHQLVTRR